MLLSLFIALFIIPYKDYSFYEDFKRQPEIGVNV